MPRRRGTGDDRPARGRRDAPPGDGRAGRPDPGAESAVDLAGDLPGRQLADPDVRAKVGRTRIRPQHRGQGT
ncbi:MAG: hypothetical protein QJR14_09605 [Bacillota bacterium]|nr:hypothetical protein [Bacillota bacterium]